MTIFIATISPALEAFDETVSTLKFADRARNVVNRAVINLKPDLKAELAKRDAEIQRLTLIIADYASVVQKRRSGQLGYAAPQVSIFSPGLQAAARRVSGSCDPAATWQLCLCL